MSLKAYQVQVIAGQRPLDGLLASPHGTFTARRVISGPRMTPELAMQEARQDMASTGLVAWVNVVACRRACEIEVESEALLAEMLKGMRSK